MQSWLEYGDTTVDGDEALDIERLVAARTPFWLDIEDPSDGVVDGIATVLDLHPLAVEDSKEFGQRGKLVRYGDVAMLVGFGIDELTGEPVEVHGYLTRTVVVTFRRAPSTALAEMHRTGSLRALLGGEPIRVLHHLATELHDEFPRHIDELEARLARVEEAMLVEPLDEHLGEIMAIRQRADELRRTLTPGRDLAIRSMAVTALPGDNAEASLYASDVADELRLIVSDLAAVGERCIAALGLHASLANNRQGAASRQLAAVATVFLPITFVVGFFGMNFEVLVDDFEQGWAVFLIFGVLLNVVCVLGTLWWLGRRGWR